MFAFLIHYHVVLGSALMASGRVLGPKPRVWGRLGPLKKLVWVLDF